MKLLSDLWRSLFTYFRTRVYNIYALHSIQYITR